MTIATLIEWVTSILLIIVGLSHMLQPRAWSDLFCEWLTKKWAGLAIGLMTLPLGVVIIAGHNLWTWRLPVIVTILGWAWTTKGTLYLLWPGLVQRVARGRVERLDGFVIAGAVLLAIGAAVMADLVLLRA